MKAVILAGGLGTRLSEEIQLKPKPMVEVGGKPILWHVLNIYSHFGINEFIICCGYEGYPIMEYFANYFLHTCDVTFHMDIDNHMEIHQRKSEPWKVTLVDTGDLSQTGGRPWPAGLIQSLSQGLLPGLSACSEVGGIAPFPCLKALMPQPIST